MQTRVWPSRKLWVLAIASTLIGAASAPDSGSAQAPSPNACPERQSSASTYAIRCTVAGPSIKQYRAVATCTGGQTVYGNWTFINSGQWSRADCGPNRFVSGNAEFR